MKYFLEKNITEKLSPHNQKLKIDVLHYYEGGNVLLGSELVNPEGDNCGNVYA